MKSSNLENNLTEIRFVSKLLRSKISSTSTDKNFEDNETDHNKSFDSGFWSYCKKYIDQAKTVLPQFSASSCYVYYKRLFKCSDKSKQFDRPTWMPEYERPTVRFNDSPPTYQEITRIIKKMKTSGSPCPLDQISVIVLKRIPYLRSYLTVLIQNIWDTRHLPINWKHAVTILIHKKDSAEDPANFRPITLEPVFLKVFTSLLRNRILAFLKGNNYIEHNIQKGFLPKISGTYEHTRQLAQIIRHAKLKQRTLVITLLDLKNAFGEVHHKLIIEILKYHHLPNEVQNMISDLYGNFTARIACKDYITGPILVERGVLQGDGLSPLLFNLVFNSFIQTIKSDEFKQLSYRYTKLLTPKHWLQFADDATAISGSESDNQILLNAFTRWCNWASMIIRVDKCKSFGIRKASTCSTQFQPKLFVNGERVKPVEPGGSFKYLGRYFDYDMDNSEHKRELLQKTTEILNIIDCLPLHPRKKLMIYSRYLLSKISWDLTIADLDVTWVKNTLDNLCHNHIRRWLEIPPCGTIEILLLSTTQYGINLLDISTKFEQCQVTIRKSLKESPNEDIRELFQIRSVGSNIKYDSFQSTREVLAQTRQSKTEKITGLKSQSEVVTSVWQEALVSTRSKWFSVQKVLPKNIFNFTVRYFNNTLATKSNMQKWGKAFTKICDYCPEVQTLNHVVKACKSALREGRYTWRHNSILLNISLIIKSK